LTNCIVDSNSAEHALLQAVYEAAVERGAADIYISWQDCFGDDSWAAVCDRADDRKLWQVTGPPPKERLLQALRREVME
jgi:hypothetical protein